VYRLAGRRLLRFAALAYPVFTGFVVIGTANHYLFDVLAGTLLWWFADRAVAQLTNAEDGLWPRRRRRSRWFGV
jgi:hypothetical protein